MKNLLKLLSLLFVMTLTFSLSACSDDDDETTEQSYSAGFDTMHSSGDWASDTYAIENAFVAAFESGFGATSANFKISGKASDTDAKVKAACAVAEASLANRTWSGNYTYAVKNNTTGTTIYTNTFGN